MEIEDIKEGEVYVNKKNGRFVYVTEITHCGKFNTPYHIVCSIDCPSKTYAKTSMERQVLGAQTEFIQNYDKEKTSLSDKAFRVNMVNSILNGNMAYPEENVKAAVKRLDDWIQKAPIYNNDAFKKDARWIFNVIFGKRLVD